MWHFAHFTVPLSKYTVDVITFLGIVYYYVNLNRKIGHAEMLGSVCTLVYYPKKYTKAVLKNVLKLKKKIFFQKTANKLEKNWVWDKKKCQNCVKKISHSLCNFLLTYPQTIFLWRGEQKEIIKSFWSFETSRPEVQYFPALYYLYILFVHLTLFSIFFSQLFVKTFFDDTYYSL